jgi:tRNA dimethylallyltransferase
LINSGLRGADQINPGKKILGVVGPTAAGKTRLALELARRFDGEVISCDSVQIFKRLDIGSAKPEKSETGEIPYHLISVFEPDYRIDAGVYKKMAEECIREIQKKEKLPILAGGTGMYFNSIYYGLFNGPGRNDSIRASLKEKAATGGVSSLYEELEKADPDTSLKVGRNDLLRIIRALEVLYTTGSPISRLYKNNIKLELDWFIIGLDMDRKMLYHNIDRRIDKMISLGLIDETQKIMNKYGADAYALSSIGYRHAVNYIRGIWNFEEFAYCLKRDTRHYAKRQITWFKKNPDIHWFDMSRPENIFYSVRKFLDSY